MIRTAKSKWFGNLKHGRGFIVSDSGELSALSYSFKERFEDAIGINPEEMVAAAHSSCLSMAIAAELDKRAIEPQSIDVTSAISFENIANTWSIPEIHLKVVINALGANPRLVEEAANIAKVNCPISKLLRTSIRMELFIHTKPSHLNKTDVESVHDQQ